MNLAKDLAWRKIFSGRSTNLKIEKSRFFRIFATISPYFISFPDTQWAYKITIDNINIKWSLKRIKNSILCYKGVQYYFTHERRVRADRPSV